MGPRRQGLGGLGGRGATRRNETITRGLWHLKGWAVLPLGEDLIGVNVDVGGAVFTPQTILYRTYVR